MITNKNFYFNLFEKNIVHPFYNTISLKNSEASFLHINNKKPRNFKLHSFQYFPNYLDFKPTNNLKCKKIFQKNGYAIDLNDSNSVENYISKYCKTNFRGNIRRPLKRLESCLNVTYKMFYGNINNDEYKTLMELFFCMLKKRFELRNDKNLILDNWNFYLNNAFNLINEKKASLFVTFNNETPIAFSLNFHFNTVFYFAIPTFDLDYSKFTLGNTVIYKNLEWCFENGFDIFDMGYGGFENKINWCNTTYNFEHHVMSKPKNILSNLYAFMLKHKYRIINYLILKNLTTKFRNLKNYFKKEQVNNFIEYKFIKLEKAYTLENNNILKTSFNKESNNYLMKPVCDFLYTNKEHINDVEVFKILNEHHAYFIKGKYNQIKIELTNI